MNRDAAVVYRERENCYIWRTLPLFWADNAAPTVCVPHTVCALTSIRLSAHHRPCTDKPEMGYSIYIIGDQTAAHTRSGNKQTSVFFSPLHIWHKKCPSFHSTNQNTCYMDGKLGSSSSINSATSISANLLASLPFNLVGRPPRKMTKCGVTSIETW